MASANELYQEANCFTCFGISHAKALRLALEARWLLALDPNADTSPSGLLQSASCLRCNSNVSIGDLLELALLNQIQSLT